MKLEDFLSGQPGVKYLECVTHHVGGRGGQIERQEASHGTSGPRQSRKPDEPEQPRVLASQGPQRSPRRLAGTNRGGEG